MQNVKMNKSSLLEIVKKNRKLHDENYKEARAAFHQKVIERLAKLTDAVVNNPTAEPKTVVQNCGLVVPITQIDDYDRVISMLENSIDDVIELAAAEFNQYVRDEWHWKNQFTASTMSYNNKM
jgi:hypothetical protein